MLILSRIDVNWVLIIYLFVGVFLQIPPRARTLQSDKKVQCYEPATMKYLGFSSALTPDEVSYLRILGMRLFAKLII